MKIIALSFALLLGSISTMAKKPLPKECKVDCKTPYGTLLGTSKNGVKAYSNCQSKCVIFDPNKEAGVYTGIKWQCVEYARRWLFIEHNLVYGDVDYAYDIWDKIKEYKSPKEKASSKTIAVSNIPNGKIRKFQKGDLLIYSKDFLGTGHVAVIVEISYKDNWIRVAEENYNNERWPSDYARQISMTSTDSGFQVNDAYVLGIKRMTKN